MATVNAGTLNPDYNPNTWKLGYQSRQSGLAGPSVFEAMSNPPTAMADAAGNPSVGPAKTDTNLPELNPIYS